MKLNPIVYVVVGVLVLGGLFFLFKPKTQQNTQSNPSVNKQETQQAVVAIESVVMKAGIFEPQTLIIQTGTKVIFKNEDTQDHWPASAIHPTHGIYPEFDPRQNIKPGDEWSFVFNKVGNWKYHDHLSPSTTGEIRVVENKEELDKMHNTFEIVIQNKKIVSGPTTIKVNQGEDITIKITSDEAEEFHVHAYDESVELELNKQAMLTFNAKLSGRFPFELEKSKTELGALEVQPK